MTAAMKQSLRVYIVNFEGCTTKMGFLMRLARAFKLDAARIVKGEVWKAFCERLSSLTASDIPVCVRLVGLDDAYTSVPKECEALLRLLRAACSNCGAFRAEAMIGNMKWKV